jgi:hypothetical protein
MIAYRHFALLKFPDYFLEQQLNMCDSITLVGWFVDPDYGVLCPLLARPLVFLLACLPQ